MKTKYRGRWFVLILLATMLVACSDSQVTATSTNVPATASPTATTTPPPPTATMTPTATAIPLVWEQIYSGQDFERDTVTGFVIDPKDQDVLYAGMKNAGIYKSIDGGLSWQSASHGLADTHVTSLLIDPPNPLILYAGTRGGIYKTEDGGENWNRIGDGIYLLMDPQDSSHLYARNENGIYETTDQGKSWEIVYSPEAVCPGKIISWDIHPTDGKTLFIGAGEKCEPGVYMSTDSGHTWAIIWLLPPSQYNNIQYLNPFAIGVDKQGNYYIASIWGLISIQSNNEGIGWKTTREFAPPATFDYSTDSVYHFRDSHLYKNNLTLGKPNVGVVTSITISPYDPNTIYISGEGLSVSRDGGLTWAKLNNGLGSEKLQLNTGTGNMPILYLQSGECEDIHDPEHRAFHDDAGQPLYFSTNGGQTWELSLQTGCYFIKDASELVLYRVGQEWTWSTDGSHYLGWVWLSTDQGNTWQTRYVMDVMIPFTVVAHPFQNGILYAYSPRTFRSPGYGGEKTFISVDYGNNWKTADSTGKDLKPCYGSTLQFIDAYRPMAIDPHDGNHVFVIDNKTLLESHDSCDTTNTFASAPNTSMNSIAFDPGKPDTLYAGTDGGAYISFDSGKTWNQVNAGLPDTTVVYSIAVDKDSNVYAATPFGIFKLEGR